jgi:hypothetical protein
MKIDITNIIVALFLAIAGYYFGASHSNLLVFDIFPALSLIVSACTLFIGQQALNSWKNQFKHQEQYKSLVNAEKCFRSYCISEEELRAECIKRRSEHGVNFELPMQYSDAVNRKKFEYQQAWDELAITCADFIKDNIWLTPDAISKGYISEIVQIHDDDFTPQKSNFYEMHGANLTSGKKVFHDYRAQLS